MKPRPRSRPPARLPGTLIALLIAAGVVLRIVHFPVAVYTPDEDVYAHLYAVPMFENGLGELPRLVRVYNAWPDMLQFPSPTRVGHLWAIVGLMNLVGSDTIQTAAWVSAIASMLILLLIARIGVRFLNPWTAAIALLFAVASPLDLAMARRVWGDELFALCSLLTVLAFLEAVAGSRRGLWRVLCLAIAGFSILVKETGLLLLALATVGLAIDAWRSAGARAAALAAAGGAAALLAAGAVLVTACGGLEPLRATFARAASAGGVNQYMLKYQTGGPGYYARGLALLQPLPVALGLLSAALAVTWAPPLRSAWSAPRARAALAALGGFTLAFAAVALAYPQKNMRFLSPLYAPLALLAGALVWAAIETTRARHPRAASRIVVPVIALALLAAAVADHQRFVEYFILRGVPDLATPWLTQGR